MTLLPILMAAEIVMLHVADGAPVDRPALEAALQARGVAVERDPLAAAVIVQPGAGGVRLLVRDERGATALDRVLAADGELSRVAALLVVEALKDAREREDLGERIELLHVSSRYMLPEATTNPLYMPETTSAVRDGRPLRAVALFESLGRPDLAREFEAGRKRQRTYAKFGLASALVASVMLDAYALAPEEPWSRSALVAGTGTIFVSCGFLIAAMRTPQPVSRPELERMVNVHNARLREDKGLPPERTLGVGLVPAGRGDGAGVAVFGTF